MERSFIHGIIALGSQLRGSGSGAIPRASRRMKHCAAVGHLALKCALMENGFRFFRLTRPGVSCGGLLLAVVVCFASGCGQEKKSSLPAAMTPSAASRPVLALHWIGKTRLAQDTNAAYQMEIWKMPESVRLETQTLDKLARALPVFLGAPGGSTTQDFSGVIRVLLADLVQAESFCEVRASTNQPNEFALAIRLPAERSALWNTNLAALAEAFTGGKAANSAAPTFGWRVSRRQLPAAVQFALVGDWTVLGVGAEDNKPFADFVRRFSATNPPTTDTNNYWIEADANLGSLFHVSPSVATQSLPSVHLTLAGDGHNVRTRGNLTFPEPLPIQLGPWNIPTNLIHDPLVSFTAVRGVKSWIESSSLWQNLPDGAAPDQLYFWALDGIPFQTYFTAAWPDSSNRFYNLSQRAMQNLNRYITNDLCEATSITNANGIFWTCNPFIQAFMRHDLEPAGEMVSGGLFPLARLRRPMPPELLSQFISQTNLLYYDWEITEARAFGWFQLASFLRMVSGKAPLESESAGVKWLVGVSTNLGNAVTTLRLNDPTHVALSRNSSAGLTGLELQLLIEWLESPDFPRGLHTFNAPVKPPLKKRPVGAPASAGSTATNALH
jgi:hypothetical protein